MARGYGATASDPYRKVDADTLFRVGSISKTLVWIEIMQLVEQGNATKPTDCPFIVTAAHSSQTPETRLSIRSGRSRRRWPVAW